MLEWWYAIRLVLRASSAIRAPSRIWDGPGPFGEIRQTKMHVSPNVVYEEIEGFIVILDLVTEAYYMFDPVAAVMWKALLESDNDNEALYAVQNRFAPRAWQFRA